MFTEADREREFLALVEKLKIPLREYRSRDKLRVEVKPMTFGDGKTKNWVLVHLKNGGSFAPSFEDLFRMIVAIVHCENEKYDWLGWPPSDMVSDFLAGCVNAADRLSPRKVKTETAA